MDNPPLRGRAIMIAIRVDAVKEMQEDINWGMTNCSKVRTLTAKYLLKFVGAMALKILDVMLDPGDISATVHI